MCIVVLYLVLRLKSCGSVRLAIEEGSSSGKEQAGHASENLWKKV
jgi:hypothetical protein